MARCRRDSTRSSPLNPPLPPLPPPTLLQVCLSLLGTFSGSNATEKWDPAVSTIFQVLVSIQSQILVPNPMANEPGYDGKEDSAQSKEYNAKLRLHTMRHAMTAVLRSPPAGFEDAVRAHFAAQRDRVLQQCWAWAEEAPADMRDKMLGALHALHAALPPCTGDGASSGLPSDAAGADAAGGASTPAAPGPSAAGASGAHAGEAAGAPRPISSSKFRDGVELSGAAPGGADTDDDIYAHDVYDRD